MIYSAPYFGTKTDLNLGWDPGLWNRINRKIAYLFEYIIFFIRAEFIFVFKKKRKHTKSTEMQVRNCCIKFSRHHFILITTLWTVHHYAITIHRGKMTALFLKFQIRSENFGKIVFILKKNVYNKLVPHSNAQKILRYISKIAILKRKLGSLKKHNFTWK